MTDDERVVAGIAEQLTRAWNTADAAAYGRQFEEDAIFVDIRGGLHRSRQAVVAGHHALFETIYRESKLDFQVLTVSRTAKDILAHVQFWLSAPHAPLPPNDGSVASILLRETHGQWAIASFHNTLRLRLAAA